jgi:ribosomal protein L25 (general stress protein Ctc)
MTETHVTTLTRQKLKTPRSAAIAGIIFAILYGASMVLLNISLSHEPVAGFSRLETDSGTITLALNLIPFAGIAFLWFIGVIRDLFSDWEDRLFATVFLGSGLLFLALTFIGSALSAGMLSAYATGSSNLIQSGLLIYNKAVIYHVFNIYAIRMAGVFMVSLATIWLRTGLMHRGLAFLTYVLALVLLLSIDYSYWVTLIFPGWVLGVSLYILIRNLHNQPDNGDSEEMKT